MTRPLLIILTVLSFTTLSFSANCQKCGGQLLFRIYDKGQKDMYPSMNDAILLYSSLDNPLYRNFKILDTVSYNFSIAKFDITGIAIDSNHNCLGTFFSKKTGCGLPSWDITIEKGNSTMEIEFKNLAIEIDYLVDSIPFRNGKYYIDCANPKGATFYPSSGKLPYEWQPDCIIPATLNLRRK